MILHAERFPQKCAQNSLGQIRDVAETASPSARRFALFCAATSFGLLPKLPLQDCAETPPDTRKPVSGEQAVSAVRNWIILNSSNGLSSCLKLGGVNHPLRGWGRTPQAGSPTPTPRGFRAPGPAWPELPDPTTATRSAKNMIAVVFHPSSQPEEETTHG